MTEVQAIFEAFGGYVGLAETLGLKRNTVWDWRNNGEIPPWRRPMVLDAARRLGKALDGKVIAYLLSDERPARVNRAA